MNENKPMLDEDFLGPFLPEAHVEPEMPVRRSGKSKVITTLTLTSATCRWPFGDPTAPDFHYCGQPSLTDGPYCDTHEAISRPSGQRKNRAQAA